MLIWNASMKFGAIIPNHDVFNHTAWVGNIARNYSLSPALAYANPITGDGMASNLYPFSMHALCAYVVELSNIQASLVVIAFTKVIVIIFWPLGVFNLARAAGLKSFLGPVAAAGSTVVLYNFPYTTLGWGGVAMVAGLVVLIHLVAITLNFISSRNLYLSCSIILSMFTLVVLHTSEAFIFPIMVAVLGAPAIMQQKKHRTISIPLGLLCASVFFFPWIDKWIGPGLIANLASVPGGGVGTVYQAVGQIIMISPGMEFHSIWIPVFLLTGTIAITYIPQFRHFLFMYLILALGVFITSQISSKPWTEISFAFSPWYRQYARMTYFLVPAVALLCGVAFEFLETRRIGIAKRLGPALKLTFGTLLLIAILGTTWNRTSRVFSILVSEHSPLSKGDLLAPSKVQQLRDLDVPILASFDSGIGYWATDYNMKILGSPFLGSDVVATREALLDTVADLGNSQPTMDLLRSTNISYVATNSRSMNGTPPRPNPTAIEQSQNFDVFWKGDTVTVWKIRPITAQFLGNFSTSFSTANQQQAKWVLEKNFKLQITNTENVEHEVEISFSVSQNTCQSTQSISLWDGTDFTLDSQLPSKIFESEKPVSSAEPGLIKVRALLSPYQTLVPTLSFDSKYCLFPETGAVIYGAISPVSVRTIK
jgi:hypothetical protein